MLGLLEELFSIESDFTFNPNKSRMGLEIMIPETNKNAFFIADCQGYIAGMCSIQTLISTAEGEMSGIIEDVVVDRKFRRKGIATQLLDAAQEWANDKGFKRLQLLADVTNRAAIDFYHANRWSKTQMICLRKYTEDL